MKEGNLAAPCGPNRGIKRVLARPGDGTRAKMATAGEVVRGFRERIINKSRQAVWEWTRRALEGCKALMKHQQKALHGEVRREEDKTRGAALAPMLRPTTTLPPPAEMARRGHRLRCTTARPASLRSRWSPD